ncbi:hypothetical protein ABZP36_016584 [Zizania latifolia]
MREQLLIGTSRVSLTDYDMWATETDIARPHALRTPYVKTKARASVACHRLPRSTTCPIYPSVLFELHGGGGGGGPDSG